MSVSLTWGVSVREVTVGWVCDNDRGNIINRLLATSGVHWIRLYT